MVHTEASILIDRPIEHVFETVADFSRTGEWRQGMLDYGFESDAPSGVGSRYRYKARFGGTTMDLDGEITAWDPPHEFRWKPHAGPFPVTGGVRLETTGNATRVTTFSDSEPTGVMKYIGWLMKWIGERQYRQELGRLKRLLESEGES